MQRNDFKSITIESNELFGAGMNIASIKRRVDRLDPVLSPNTVTQIIVRGISPNDNPPTRNVPAFICDLDGTARFREAIATPEGKIIELTEDRAAEWTQSMATDGSASSEGGRHCKSMNGATAHLKFAAQKT